MEYASCGDLLEKFETLRGNIELVKYFTRMILAGLASIHETGIVHGGLHPKIVLVFEGNEGLELKITDFGVSKLMS